MARTKWRIRLLNEETGDVETWLGAAESDKDAERQALAAYPSCVVKSGSEYTT